MVALLTHQKFYDKRVFESGELCLIQSHFELRQNKYFHEIKKILAINQNDAKFTFMEKFLEKTLFYFFQKISPLLDEPDILK